MYFEYTSGFAVRSLDLCHTAWECLLCSLDLSRDSRWRSPPIIALKRFICVYSHPFRIQIFFLTTRHVRRVTCAHMRFHPRLPRLKNFENKNVNKVFRILGRNKTKVIYVFLHKYLHNILYIYICNISFPNICNVVQINTGSSKVLVKLLFLPILSSPTKRWLKIVRLAN